MNTLSASAQENLDKWLTEPKYAEYKESLQQLVDKQEWQVLEDSFFKVVPFGTGGRRGTVGIGSNRINNVTIGESAQGMAAYLLKQDGENAKKAGVVIGFDSRSTSVEFSQLTASIFAANGFKVYLFDSCRATPELSFAVRHLKAAAGVVISASHNPPPDNGFKAYWSDGGQIVPPHDKGIMDEVAQVEEIKTTDFKAAEAARHIQIIGKDVDEAYWMAVCNESLVQTRSARIVYSPLHGTGITSVMPVLQKAGFTEVTLVSEQMTPDGAFPNIKNNIPNPEVVSASDLVTKYAQEQEADIGITTDPDADRLGVVARTKDGSYQFLTGNQIAALLGFFVLDQLKQQNKLQPNDFIVKTIVTTDFLNAMADEFDVKIYDNLLIGFKYVAEMIREKEGTEQFLFGGEESHGILKGTYARDKDAAIAALLMAELTSWLKDQNKSLPEFLDELYARYGLFWETLHTVAYPGAEGSANMKAIMAKLRANPPQEVGNEKVIGIIDRLTSDEGPKGDVVILVLSEDRKNRVTVRPSGTEPKLKLYIQLYDKEVNKEKMLQRAGKLAQNLQSWLLP